MIVVEKLRWDSIPGVVSAYCILPHESPLIFVVGVTNVYHLEVHSFALHDELGFHLSFLHLQR